MRASVVENGSIYNQNLILNPYVTTPIVAYESIAHMNAAFSDLSLNKTALEIYGAPWQSGSTVVRGASIRCRAQ